MFERFTDRARRVVVLAQEEARMLDHNYIGTEHILLGLIHEGEGVAARALTALGISLDATRQAVEDIIGRGTQAPSGHIPFTPRSKKVLELSLREALTSAATTSAPSTSCSPSSARVTASAPRSWSAPAWASTGPGSRSSTCCTASPKRTRRLLPLPCR